jgi:hypothetical protein
VQSQDIRRYIESQTYVDDLAATRTAWGEPPIPEIAGVFVFLTYLSLPSLVAVRSGRGATARSTLDGRREYLFLRRMLGVDDQASWHGGIANPRVRRLAGTVHEHHRRFAGMKTAYLDFLAATLTLAPLRVRRCLGAPLGEGDRGRYWRYMGHAMSLVGGGGLSERVAEERCRQFVEARAGVSADGERLYSALLMRHPRYVQLAGPVLYAASRRVVQEMTGHVHAQ